MNATARPATPNAFQSPSVDIDFEEGGSVVCLNFGGDWVVGAGKRPASDAFVKAVSRLKPTSIRIDCSRLGRWDSRFTAYLLNVVEWCEDEKVKLDSSDLPEAVSGLLNLATSVPERETDGRRPVERTLFYRVGSSSIRFVDAVLEFIEFVGQATCSLGRFLTGRAKFRRSDFWLLIQQVGADALAIVALISFLVGLIMAFVGAIQLRQFGASIYTADLVALAMVREMGAMMAGIIMCGRTGASFAAQLGTMKVNEEIDALQTLGLPPMDFLVLPRMLAMILMMPLLVLFANYVGIIGGLLVSVSMLDITFSQYVNQTISAIDLVQFSTGMIKSVVFGVIVAASGCLRGMQCGNSSAAVGVATTSAVVTGITAIIIADALFAIIFNVFGI